MANIEKAHSPLLGALHARGLTDPAVQRLMHRLIAGGHGPLVAQTLGHWLLQEGITAKRIPVNAGQRTPELMANASTSIFHYVEEHLKETSIGLRHLLNGTWQAAYNQWLNDFRLEIQTSSSLVASITQAELNDRLCIAALNGRDALFKLERKYPHLFVLETESISPTQQRFHSLQVLGEEGLELLCKVIAKAALEGFEDPNGVQHRLLHPSEDSGEKTS